MPELDALAQRALDAARAAGAQDADVLVARSAQTSVEVRGGALEEAQRAEDTELGLRVLVGRRQACISISDVSDAALTAAAERAVAMARIAPEDPSAGLADPADLAAETDAAPLDLADDDAPSPADLQEDAAAAEAAARAVAGITQIDSASAGHGRRDLFLAATNGFAAGYARTDHGISCVAITGTGTGMERDWFADMRAHRADLFDPAHVGRTAAERALERANPRKPPTGSFPVLFDERVAASLVGHLVAAASGSAVARGASWLRERLHERVLPEALSLVEEPHRPRAMMSRPFDAEGLATREAAIVEEGRLLRWILDLGTARRLGMQSTANAVRGTGAPPSPSAGNLTLRGGQGTRADLMREMGTGLLVTSLIGSTISPTTGDYSRGASGLWVEDGEATHAVSECTIAGNLLQMLGSLVAADDARDWAARRVPSLLVPRMTVAGQ